MCFKTQCFQNNPIEKALWSLKQRFNWVEKSGFNYCFYDDILKSCFLGCKDLQAASKNNTAPSDLQTPLPLPEFFPIDQRGLPSSDH